MSTALPLLQENEIRPADSEAGFGALQTARGALPLKAMEVRAAITGLTYDLTLRQTFVNNLDVPMEATYIFPLPSRAAVSSFRLEVAGRVIEGQLKERGQARQEYQQAIQRGHRAALAEEDRPSLFNMKVGNIVPGETARVELTLNGLLTFADGEAEFRFPFVVAPRYIPGQALAGDQVGDGVAWDTDRTPDASRLSPPVLLPGYPNPVQLLLAVSVDAAGLPARDFRSSLHAIQQQSQDGPPTIQLYPQERLNRDFILRFNVDSEEVTSGAKLVPDSEGDGGVFALNLVPPALSPGQVRPRDIVFLLDRSGSMEGWKMVAARRALGRMIDSLTIHDNFGVVLFDHQAEFLTGHNKNRLLEATDRNRFRSVEDLGKVEARGGTEIAMALKHGTKLLSQKRPERDRILVLVTDGQVGNEDEILRSMSKKLSDIRVFTLGIDRAVNEGFLTRLAAIGGGSCELVESEDRLDVMDRTHRKIGTPVLLDLTVQAQGIDIDQKSITPQRLPDLFAGSPLQIFGRYSGSHDGQLVISATTAQGVAWSQTINAGPCDRDGVSKLWARGRIRDLEDAFAKGHNREALEQQILQTSLQYGVLSRFTAFVAVDRDEVIEHQQEPTSVTQPVESPEGWDMLAAPPPPQASFGGGPVAQSRSSMRAQMAPARPAPAAMPPSGARGFTSAKRKKSAPVAMPPKEMISYRYADEEEASASFADDGLPQGAPLDEWRAELRSEEKQLRPQPLSNSTKAKPKTMATPQATGAATPTAGDILKALQGALQRGTDGLGAELWAQRDNLLALMQQLKNQKTPPAEAVVLEEIAAKLQAMTTPPDSAMAIALWQKLEPVLKSLSAQPAGRSAGFWR